MRLDSVLGHAALGLGAVDGLLGVAARLPEAVEDIVLVGGDDELVDGETHAEGEVTGEDVAKVARGNDEADLVADVEGFLLACKREVGVEVVDCLSKDTGPVDGVNGAELVGGVDLRVGEEGLDDVLQKGVRENAPKGAGRERAGLTWQLSKLPVTARLWTLASRTVVIWSSWTGLTLPLG